MKLHRLNLLVSVDFGGGFTSLSSMTLATIRASHYFPGERNACIAISVITVVFSLEQV